MQAIRRFSTEQYRAALESWSWLELTNKTPRFTSPFGDVFLEAADGWWFLDAMSGTLERHWDSGEELQAALNTPDGQDQFLLLGLARDAEALGVALAEDQVYDLTPPPVLGGPLDPANVAATDFVVALNIAGQIHDQVRNLPPGTPIKNVTFD